jgi:BASS family bile acid:Na+ symporter
LKVRDLWRNRNAILLLAVALGLGVGYLAEYTQALVVPGLALIMALSTTSISNADFVRIRSMVRPILLALFLTYVILGGFMLLMAYYLVDDRALWAGFVLLAMVPPAVAVVPYSYILGGEVTFTLFGMLGAYLLALGLTPGMTTFILGTGAVDPMQIFITLAELVVAPLIVSRLVRLKHFSERIHIAEWRGAAVNWGFFLVIFTIVGLNRSVFFGEYDVLWRVALISLVFTFLLAYVIDRLSRLWHISRPSRVSLVLLGTTKNFGLASALALTLFGERAAIPGAVGTVFSILCIVWLTFYFREDGRQENHGKRSGGVRPPVKATGPGVGGVEGADGQG